MPLVNGLWLHDSTTLVSIGLVSESISGDLIFPPITGLVQLYGSGNAPAPGLLGQLLETTVGNNNYLMHMSVDGSIAVGWRPPDDELTPAAITANNPASTSIGELFLNDRFTFALGRSMQNLNYVAVKTSSGNNRIATGSLTWGTSSSMRSIKGYITGDENGLIIHNESGRSLLMGTFVGGLITPTKFYCGYNQGLGTTTFIIRPLGSNSNSSSNLQTTSNADYQPIAPNLTTPVDAGDCYPRDTNLDNNASPGHLGRHIVFDRTPIATSSALNYELNQVSNSGTITTDSIIPGVSRTFFRGVGAWGGSTGRVGILIGGAP